MGGVIEIPVWLAVVAGVLGLAGLIDRIVGPGMRWLLRRRVERAVDRLNERLQLRIQPFKLARRRVLVDRLTYDPQVMAAMEAHAEETGEPRRVALERVERYARETVPAFSAFAYFKVGARGARWLSRSLYDVRVGRWDEAQAEAVGPDAAVVFVMNHRSNMDYVLVTHLAARRSALSYAVGEWARVWPLAPLIRAMGAYFIERRSRGPLYRKVLARYVQMAIEGGVTQAVFPEGGLSRDGRLREPKLGLISYMVDGYRKGRSREVVFVPVGLAYDRVLEDRILTRAKAEGPEARFRGQKRAALLFGLRLFWNRLTGRWGRFGHAAVGFGEPLRLSDWVEGDEPVDIEALGAELMRRVGEEVPVLPVPLACAALLDGEARDEAALGADMAARAARLEAAGAHVQPVEGKPVAAALAILRRRRLVEEADGRIRMKPDEREVFAFYAASIEHLGEGVEREAAAG